MWWHILNLRTWLAETGGFYEFVASLVYRMSSRTAKPTQKDPVSNKQTKIKKRESWFFPFPMWIYSIRFRPSGLAGR